MQPHAVAALAVLASVGVASGAQAHPLAPYRSVSRVLVVLAPGAGDPRAAKQRQLFESMGPGTGERDLILVEAWDGSSEAQALRDEFRTGTGFQVVLVGKDGGAKLTSEQPLAADRLFPLIDSMPMRRREMIERR